MTKNKSQAIALRYDGKEAPKVTAKGEGFLAKEIIEKAKANGIPIEQNEELTALLANVSINKEIPQSLYLAVAQLLIYLYYIEETN